MEAAPLPLLERVPVSSAGFTLGRAAIAKAGRSRGDRYRAGRVGGAPDAYPAEPIQVMDEELVRLNVRLPEGIDAAGLVVIAVVDFFNDVAERNESNNVAVSPSVSSRRGARVR